MTEKAATNSETSYFCSPQAIDRFRGSQNGILIATDVAARGLDIPGVRTVVHYQLPHSAEVYVHRSGRTARASADGCSIALVSANETSKFASLCKSFSKESFQRFPVDNSYMPEVLKRLSLARQIDKIVRKESQEKASKTWFERNAELVELVVDNDDSEEERANNYKQKKVGCIQLKKLQQELDKLLSHPLQPKSFSHRYLAGAGVSPLLQHQFEELAKQNASVQTMGDNKRRKLAAFGQDLTEPLQALRTGGQQYLLLGWDPNKLVLEHVGFGNITMDSDAIVGMVERMLERTHKRGLVAAGDGSQKKKEKNEKVGGGLTSKNPILSMHLPNKGAGERREVRTVDFSVVDCTSWVLVDH
ncbi:DEAD-box ATP-dependent RNA helicase 13 [Cucumis melo var. makuwa]|uniref:DEAD-box ATP-dependent RNA helicase 13 n=1 Tax=Cucumis melo var. makuwa TaxID=1194695 RepID=A0A5A7SNT8_CUCMM|nr:DEAD-box ATP-dependent RNA helicase 13 [Cucumis melo var. makuwa]